MTRFQKTTIALIAATTLATGITAASAAGEADIKYRQNNYKAIGAHMGAIGAIMKGEVDHKYQLSTHADAIAAIAKDVETLFPEGSGPDAGETRALPVIWTDADEFQKVVDGFKAAAANAAKVAESGDMAAMGDAVKQLGAACGACHKTFRAK